MNLVYLDGKKEPYTTSEIIAECVEVQHHTITRTIRKNLERFERFGKVGFNIQAMESGQSSKNYILNEQQATLLITFLKNTEQVATFKENLVRAFFEMRDELAKRRVQRALEAPKRKELNHVIKNWENAPKHAYSTVTNLLLKGVCGRNAKQLKAERGGQTGIDTLTAEELERYQVLEDMAVALISLNMEYVELKYMVEKASKEQAA